MNAPDSKSHSFLFSTFRQCYDPVPCRKGQHGVWREDTVPTFLEFFFFLDVKERVRDECGQKVEGLTISVLRYPILVLTMTYVQGSKRENVWLFYS